MKRTSKTFTICLMATYTLIVTFLAIVGYYVYDGLKTEKMLDDEFSKIEYIINRDGISNNTLDIMLNNYVSDGEYLQVEMAIKNYFKDFLNECRRLEDLYTNYELNRVLYLDNFDEDAPYFETSKKIITDAQVDFTSIQKNLTDYFSKEKIMSYINDYDLSWYYVDYYENMTIDENIIDENKEEIDSSIEYVLAVLNAYNNYFTFLSDNADYWSIDEEYIYFDNDDLLEEYNPFIGYNRKYWYSNWICYLNLIKVI